MAAAHTQPGTWYTDTGATNHVTSDLSNLSFHSEYEGGDQIALGNGAGLAISRSGSSLINTPSKPLKLNHILHVPEISSNLLSVYQFCKDKNCSFIFTDTSFLIKDNLTGMTLLQGRSKNGLYPLQINLFHQNKGSFPTALASVRVSSNTWHHRLGHPALQVMHLLFSTHSLPVDGSKRLSSLCMACPMGKSSKLPFSPSNSTASKPLELIHSDIWVLLLFYQ